MALGTGGILQVTKNYVLCGLAFHKEPFLRLFNFYHSRLIPEPDDFKVLFRIICLTL